MVRYIVYNSNSPTEGKLLSVSKLKKIYHYDKQLKKQFNAGIEQINCEITKDDKTICTIHFIKKEIPKCRCGKEVLLDQEIFFYPAQTGYKIESVCLECQCVPY